MLTAADTPFDLSRLPDPFRFIAARDGREQRVALAADPHLHVGLETRTDPAGYSWRGLARGGDPAHPFVVMQFTLAGWGTYAEEGVAHRILPGMAFTAVVPSDHHYFLPADAPGWTFVWLVIRHPYVVARMTQTQRLCGPVLRLGSESALTTKATRLFEGVHDATFRDRFALEAAMLDLMVEHERFAHQSVYSPASRERLLEETRGYALAHLRRPIDVSDLAAAQGMSRSHFTRHFRATTGLTPARFVTATRLAEVRRRLTESSDTLKQIAAATGFADANHLCKVFRRHEHLSPGAFRRQMR